MSAEKIKLQIVFKNTVDTDHEKYGAAVSYMKKLEEMCVDLGYTIAPGKDGVFRAIKVTDENPLSENSRITNCFRGRYSNPSFNVEGNLSGEMNYNEGERITVQVYAFDVSLK